MALLLLVIGAIFAVPMINQMIMGVFWFLFKVSCFIYLMIWFRGTFPRFRYDQFMDIGWKIAIPVGIGGHPDQRRHRYAAAIRGEGRSRPLYSGMFRRTALFLLVCSLALAQIQYQESRKIFLLTTSQSSYAMGVAADGALRNLYWGAPLWRVEDLNPPSQRAISLPSIRGRCSKMRNSRAGAGLVTTSRRSKLLARMAIATWSCDTNRTASSRTIWISCFEDIRDAVEVTLHYRVYPEYGLVRRSATIRNGTAKPLTVESAQAAAWYLPPGEGYNLTYLTGRWAAETQINHEPIHEGEKVLESRKGHTGHNFNPWFAIDAGDASEENGRVWFGALAWSGNWRITVEQTPYRQVRVTGGLNTFDFAYPSEAQ